MTESMLKSLMKLFALLATINMDASRVFSRNFVESYLRNQFSNKLVRKSLAEFDAYLEELAVKNNQQSRKRISSLSVKIIVICNEINNELHLRSKYMILFSIIRFAHHFEARTDTEDSFSQTLMDAVQAIADALLINQDEFNNIRWFIIDKFYKVPDKSSLLVVGDYSSFSFSGIKYIQREGFEGQLIFLQVAQADMYIFYYSGKETIEMGGKTISPNHVYSFPKGASLKSENSRPVYYSDIVFAFRRHTKTESIVLDADRIDFRYPQSDIGIHEMSLHFNTGEMIGVMGGSGTGKSTLMRLLNGSMSPDSGDVFINGRSIRNEREKVEGLIGFVPQDDLLIEELTVFENLYYNAKLCLGNLSEKEIIKRIGRVLNNLDLFYIQGLKVGSPLNKFISGGQRKRLNIALELIREPYILFVDEPTSGLSSTDSENVMQLLKEQSLNGKIVVVNIHQPSSELFKMFDTAIIMDKGGYPVYAGNPLESITYIKKIAERADASEIECECCGNVQTEDILKIIELKKVNEIGEYTKERLFSPEEWYGFYKEKIDHPVDISKAPEELPQKNYKIPGIIKQFRIYSMRNFFSKLADRQFMILSLSITPLLAVILALFTKYQAGEGNGTQTYVFSLNENLPAYLFMSVIVSLFVGLIVSAEEIIKDRKILSRESYLRLNRHAYLFSKIGFLFILSAIQVILFVLIGNFILEIKGMLFQYWLILFSTSCFAVLLGLNISSGLKSIISIYINIPFILVPLILLAGVIVKYDKLHESVAGKEVVPLVGDIMASRWAYEALIVSQFRYNAYQEHFYDIEKQRQNVLYQLNFLVPEMQNRVNDLEKLVRQGGDKDEIQYLATLLKESFSRQEDVPENISGDSDGIPDIPTMRSYLRSWRKFLVRQSEKLSLQHDGIIDHLMKQGLSPGDIRSLRQDYHNEAVSDLALNRNEMKKIVEVNGKLVRKDSPVYQDPVYNNGRAQFFAGSKMIAGITMDTIWFNVAVLWTMSIILYIALSGGWLEKTIRLTNRKRKY